MPLAFLPSVLEDRGHSSLKIATAIGVYYWTGFFGGLIITCYQIGCLLWGRGTQKEITTVSETKRQIQYLILGLGVGSFTLLGQAIYPHCLMHTICRFAQGLAGAFIFFYAFLLGATIFKDKQQVFAMTAASCALNIAEVLGSSMGALLFNAWGQRAVFWFLGVVSVVNQLFLIAIIYVLKVGVPSTVPSRRVSPAATPRGNIWSSSGWDKLIQVLRSPRLGCAVILIVMAAVVKGSVEEMLPFHADHRWGFDPIHIGELFSIIAMGYIASAVTCGQIWSHLKGFQVAFSAFWLSVLGGMAWCVFITTTYCKHENVLWAGLLTYGVCLGLTHTPAALLLADAIEHEEGKAKDAVNGIWNTMWEAGGSLGFLLGGLLAEDYGGQLRLLTGCGVCCIISAALMLAVAPRETGALKASRFKQGYGSAP
eukprot:CAMPEP_0179045608 /NCGR_PEP_ID=MMETSP0796-20121207/18264_1 /TAXON_ID=73915 /ORGANISM="Pyrodinium bahamense, Strain pbaha01" /LENGTH=424 /DNA_ID=CAMNT_0020742017 /DNA_START=218 /DNA_END=1492 /DNA_ORIENTATION=-